MPTTLSPVADPHATPMPDEPMPAAVLARGPLDAAVRAYLDATRPGWTGAAMVISGPGAGEWTHLTFCPVLPTSA